MRALSPLISLLFVILLAGCAGNNAPEAEQSAAPTETAAPAQMPEVMPEDFAFSVRFGVTGKNEINTFTHTVTKDLVVKGTAKADVTLTDSEMADIYARLREINILRELKLEPEKKGCEQTPYDEEHWQIRLNGEQLALDWSEQSCVVTGDAQHLKELRTYIFERVKNKPAYQELPEAEGGYD